ncbi:MAG: AIPR family protein [Candidatus Sericytochromatia bacterium]|nr:AIPR family protein [Candidatus Sericytochromatia bacterium]
MRTTDSLEAWAVELREEALARCDLAETGAMQIEALTEVLLSYLEEAGEVDNPTLAYFEGSYEGKDAACGAWSMSEDGDRLDLFLTVGRMDGRASKVSAEELLDGFARLETFFVMGRRGQFARVEESSDAFDVLDQIYRLLPRLFHLRLFVLTDGVTNKLEVPVPVLPGCEVSCHVWDLAAFSRLVSHGPQPLSVQFADLHESPVRALVVEPPGAGYRTYLTILPGELIVAMYRQHGPRLLERNVRSFLQAKGKVNKGIQNTILSEPEMFLAFNNGLSVTAMGLEVEDLGAGIVRLVSARDFQIVNGGQTTGSLFRAASKDGADLSALSVAVKITEILQPDNLDQMAPRISQSANAQNKVNMSDFSSNNRFLRRLEELSRVVWAPPQAAWGQRQTRWFFERARGHYHDELARQGAPDKRRAWELQHPRSQMLTKTDLAKSEYSWDQFPHIVSRGAEKCYVHYLGQLEERHLALPDERAFRAMVGRLILFRETDRIVAARRFGGYKANIVTFTVALLARLTESRLDFEAIWQRQALDDDLRAWIDVLCGFVHEAIRTESGSENVVQWCKEQKAWDEIGRISVPLPAGVLAALVPKAMPSLAGKDAPVDNEQATVIDEMARVPADTWFAISGWAKAANKLSPFQRQLSFSLGRVASGGKRPSPRQAHHGKILLDEARRLGFGG